MIVQNKMHEQVQCTSYNRLSCFLMNIGLLWMLQKSFCATHAPIISMMLFQSYTHAPIISMMLFQNRLSNSYIALHQDALNNDRLEAFLIMSIERLCYIHRTVCAKSRSSSEYSIALETGFFFRRHISVHML